MEVLVNQLASQLKQVAIHLESPVESLVFSPDQVKVRTPKGTFNADQVYSTLPAHQLSLLLNDPFLQAIPSASLVVVNVGYRSSVLRMPGFGYLVPSQENEKILGVVWDSSIFPEQNREQEETRLTVMIQDTQQDDAQIQQLVLEKLAKHLGIVQVPDQLMINRKAQAIPQYLVGHSKKVKEFEKTLDPHLKVLGTAFNGVAVNECVLNAIRECSTGL